MAITGNANLRSTNEKINDTNHKQDPRTAYILGQDGSQTQKLTEYLLKTDRNENANTINRSINDTNYEQDPRTAYILGPDGSQTQKITEYLLKTDGNAKANTRSRNYSAQLENNSHTQITTPDINLDVSGINGHILRRSTRYRKPKIIFDL